MNKLLLVLTVTLQFTTFAFAETCEGWADFTKIVAYKVRDAQQMTREDALASLDRDAAGNPELGLAEFWLNYAYDHTELNYVDTWKKAYELCNSKATM